MMVVSLRGPPEPPQLHPKTIDMGAPIAPTTSRMTPIVWTLNPWPVTCTANASTAPTAIRMRLTPIPISSPSVWWVDNPNGVSGFVDTGAHTREGNEHVESRRHRGRTRDRGG